MSTLRNDLIQLAFSQPDLRDPLLHLLKTARTFGTREEMQNYLKKHPNADRTKHHVVEPKGPQKKEDDGEAATKTKGGFFARVAEKFKDVKDSVLAVIKKSPEHVHQYLGDPTYRKEVAGKMVTTAKKSPKKILTTMLHAVHHEYKENKQGIAALRKLAGKGSLDKSDKKALYSLGAYIAVSTLATIPPGGIIAGLHAIGHSWGVHIGLKAVNHAIDHGFVHFEWLESALHAVGHVAADKESEPSDDELLTRLTGHVFDALESLGDEDIEKILKDA